MREINDLDGEAENKIKNKAKIKTKIGGEAMRLDNKFMTAGIHQISFDASSLPSGVYIIRLQAGNYTAYQRALLMK